jgi:hypothetical protein
MTDEAVKNGPVAHARLADAPPDAIRCPRCCGEFLHHGTVDVGPRPREDEPAPRMIVRSDGSYFTVARSNYYRGRRSEVVISFVCEECGPVGQLVIVQHKGSTYACWEAIGPAGADRPVGAHNARLELPKETHDLDLEIELVKRNACVVSMRRADGRWRVWLASSGVPDDLAQGVGVGLALNSAIWAALRDFDADVAGSLGRKH